MDSLLHRPQVIRNAACVIAEVVLLHVLQSKYRLAVVVPSGRILSGASEFCVERLNPKRVSRKIRTNVDFERIV